MTADDSVPLSRETRVWLARHLREQAGRTVTASDAYRVADLLDPPPTGLHDALMDAGYTSAQATAAQIVTADWLAVQPLDPQRDGATVSTTQRGRDVRLLRGTP